MGSETRKSKRRTNESCVGMEEDQVFENGVVQSIVLILVLFQSSDTEFVVVFVL